MRGNGRPSGDGSVRLASLSSPPSVSARAYLRGALPAVYREAEDVADGAPDDENFAMRFIGALEEVLDPIVTMLEALPAHLDARLASPEFLDLMATWLGIAMHESLSTATRRRLVEGGIELTRTRGTARGLQLLLDLIFPPELGLTVVDRGRCFTPKGERTFAPRAIGFLVVAKVRLSETQRAALKRAVDWGRPISVRYELREPDAAPGRPAEAVTP